MSYTVTIDEDITWKFKNKDDVISHLIYYFNESTGTAIKVQWPDNYTIDLTGYE